MTLLRALAVAAALFGLNAGTADAQCDPGFQLNQIYQGNQLTGWVARTEGARGTYTEHWCLKPSFVRFGSARSEATPTIFWRTDDAFSTRTFGDFCRANGGEYHLATVSVVP